MNFLKILSQPLPLLLTKRVGKLICRLFKKYQNLSHSQKNRSKRSTRITSTSKNGGRSFSIIRGKLRSLSKKAFQKFIPMMKKSIQLRMITQEHLRLEIKLGISFMILSSQQQNLQEKIPPIQIQMPSWKTKRFKNQFRNLQLSRLKDLL